MCHTQHIWVACLTRSDEGCWDHGWPSPCLYQVPGFHPTLLGRVVSPRHLHAAAGIRAEAGATTQTVAALHTDVTTDKPPSACPRWRALVARARCTYCAARCSAPLPLPNASAPSPFSPAVLQTAQHEASRQLQTAGDNGTWRWDVCLVALCADSEKPHRSPQTAGPSCRRLCLDLPTDGPRRAAAMAPKAKKDQPKAGWTSLS